MASVLEALYNNVIQALFRSTMDEQPNKSWTPGAYYNSDRFQPSVQDVLTVKADLLRKSRLPVEMVDLIIDFAEYWPHTSTVTSGTGTVLRGGDLEGENQFIVRSYPLGYIPKWQEGNGLQIMNQYEHKYATLNPLPWEEGRPIPNLATSKVLEGWTQESRPRGEFPCRKIVFTITSHDQGWGGEQSEETGPYAGSFTWFEAGKEEVSASQEVSLTEACELAPSPHFRLISGGQDPSREAIDQPPSTSQPAPLVCTLRTVSPGTVESNEQRDEYRNNGPEGGEDSKTSHTFNHPLLPSPTCIQRNVTASRQTMTHSVTWSFDDCVDSKSANANELYQQGRGRESANGKYVRELKLGDTVTVWAKARFMGWTNAVKEVKIDVYWAV